MITWSETPAETKAIFETIRKNALANPNVYGGRYAQKNKKDAYIEFLEIRLASAFETIEELKGE
ncbi:MAG: hypothetical protein KBT03_09380 [Bacteroidales bacterium]|nr:hypothetical protein [Candidatus Scybalousia scybalohippi]